jgi:hypothetical protein
VSLSQSTSPLQLPVFESAGAPFKPSIALQRAPSYPVAGDEIAHKAEEEEEEEGCVELGFVGYADEIHFDHASRSSASTSASECGTCSAAAVSGGLRENSSSSDSEEGEGLAGESILVGVAAGGAGSDSSTFYITDDAANDTANETGGDDEADGNEGNGLGDVRGNGGGRKRTARRLTRSTAPAAVTRSMPSAAATAAAPTIVAMADDGDDKKPKGRKKQKR